jgi:hypothetical protein
MNYLKLKYGYDVNMTDYIPIILGNIQDGKSMFDRTPIFRTAEGKYLWAYDEDSFDEIKGTSIGAFKRTIRKKANWYKVKWNYCMGKLYKFFGYCYNCGEPLNYTRHGQGVCPNCKRRW